MKYKDASFAATADTITDIPWNRVFVKNNISIKIQ